MLNNKSKNNEKKPESELTLKIKRMRVTRIQTGIKTGYGGQTGCCQNSQAATVGGYYGY
jgi:hypothetical protein